MNRKVRGRPFLLSGGGRSVNGLIGALLLLAAFGLLDQGTGGRLGLAEPFGQGLASMGGLAVSLVGIYCLGITALQANAAGVEALEAVLPFDPSVLVGCVLAPDLGGWSIARGMAAGEAVGRFSGVIVSSTLGCAVSFVLPLSLAAVGEEARSDLMAGLVVGIITLPATLAVGGVLLGVPAGELAVCCAPIVVVCALLCLALVKARRPATRVLLAVGNGIRLASFVLFGVVVLGLFVPAWALSSQGLVEEALLIVVKITAVVCGAMVAARLILAWCRRPIAALARWLGVREEAAVGLILSLATSLSMLPLFGRMDRRGRVMNAAFSVSGAFALGGQMAFIASVEPGEVVAAFVCAKLAGGVCALLAARLFCPAEKEG